MAAAILVTLIVVQSWWYAYGRERRYADRSPRALAREVLALPDSSQLVTYDFQNATLDYYLGRQLPTFIDKSRNTLSVLRARCIAGRKPYVVLIREHQPRGTNPQPAIDRLRRAGFTVQRIPLRSRFTIEASHVPIIAVRVQPAT